METIKETKLKRFVVYNYRLGGEFVLETDDLMEAYASNGMYIYERWFDGYLFRGCIPDKRDRKVVYSTELKQLVWSNTNKPIHASWGLGEHAFQGRLDNVPNLRKQSLVNHLKYASVLNSFLNDKGRFDYVFSDNSDIPKHPALTKAVNAIEYELG